MLGVYQINQQKIDARHQKRALILTFYLALHITSISFHHLQATRQTNNTSDTVTLYSYLP